MNAFDPKAQFQLNKEEREAFSLLASHPLLAKGFSYALAEMAHREATQERLAGANLLILTFLNLAEVTPTGTPRFSKPLTTYGRHPDSPGPDDGTTKPGT